MSRWLLVVIYIFTFVGCLQTRSALKQDHPTYNTPTAKTPTHTVEQTKQAESSAKHEDMNDDFRKLYGRVEAVETQLQSVKENEYVKGLEAKVQQMETKMALLETTVAELNAKSKTPPPVQAANTTSKSNPIDSANSHFDNKKWEDAILAYEDYRKKNPKGAEYAHATYRIGLSFQSMGLKDDAKAFFKEVVDKFPKSKEADLAKSKLKKL